MFSPVYSGVDVARSLPQLQLRWRPMSHRRPGRGSHRRWRGGDIRPAVRKINSKVRNSRCVVHNRLCREIPANPTQALGHPNIQ